VVLLYDAKVANSLLSDFNFGIGLQWQTLSDLGEIFGARSQAPHIRLPRAYFVKIV